MESLPSNSQWGLLTAPKRALLLHGLTLASHTWEGVAHAVAEAGYHVTAPNLVGHGYRKGHDMCVQALAKDLQPYFADGAGYDCLVGHSLGGLVSLALLPLLPPTKPTSVILVDPPLELSQELVVQKREYFLQATRNAEHLEALMADNPLWPRRDAVGRSFGLQMCTTDMVEDVFKKNDPWSFSSLLQSIPRHVFLTVLVSDPALSDVCPVDCIPVHPQIQAVVLEGIDHWIQFVKPELILNTVLSSVAKVRADL
ncbi:Alpha/Beta hydrolase protein [Phlebopus sp. FC_14]|nr:Alpha/Beta hydrolase protein [Phlebopus sp. FC_14]